MLVTTALLRVAIRTVRNDRLWEALPDTLVENPQAQGLEAAEIARAASVCDAVMKARNKGSEVLRAFEPPELRVDTAADVAQLAATENAFSQEPVSAQAFRVGLLRRFLISSANITPKRTFHFLIVW